MLAHQPVHCSFLTPQFKMKHVAHFLAYQHLCWFHAKSCKLRTKAWIKARLRQAAIVKHVSLAIKNERPGNGFYTEIPTSCKHFTLFVTRQRTSTLSVRLQLCVTTSVYKAIIIIQANHKLHMTAKGPAWPVIDPMQLMWTDMWPAGVTWDVMFYAGLWTFRATCRMLMRERHQLWTNWQSMFD